MGRKQSFKLNMIPFIRQYFVCDVIEFLKAKNAL